MTRSRFSKKLLNSLLSVVLVIGLMPTLAWASPTSDDSLRLSSADQAALAASYELQEGGVAATKAQMRTPSSVALNASTENVGTASNPYDILIGQGAFCAPSAFWSGTGTSGETVIADMVVNFRQTNDDTSTGTTLFSYTFDTSKSDPTHLESSWTYAFRFSPYTGYSTESGDLLIGTASKGSLEFYFPTFDYKVNVAALTAGMAEEKQLRAGDKVDVTYYGGYLENQTSRGTNYVINLETTDEATSYSQAFVVGEDGFITINPLPTGGNYRIAKHVDVYSQEDGFEPYTGWQGTPWPDSTQSSTGGTTRRGWPAWSLASPLSQGVTSYEGSAVVYGADGVKVITDTNKTNTTDPVEATRANGWYYKNIILPSVNVTGDTVSFQLVGVAPGGISNVIASSICIATSDDASTWGTAGAEGSTIVWQATTSDVAIAATGSNWCKLVTVTASTANLQAGQTYYLVLRDDMKMGHTNSYADYVFEFSTDMDRTALWEGDATKAGAVREQGNGSAKLGFQSPTPAGITTDLTKIASCFYNEATEAVAIKNGVTNFQVHSDGSGSNWQNIAGWQNPEGLLGTKVFVYESDPCASGAYDVSGLTPVASMADGTIDFTAVNPNRDLIGRDGVNINVSGLKYATTYYLVVNEEFNPNNTGALGKPIVMKFTTAPYNPSFALTTQATDVKMGQSFTVNVEMSDITASGEATLTWSENLELVSIEAGSALSGDDASFVTTEKDGFFSFVANEGTIDGTVAVVTFKCVKNGNATVGATGITVGASVDPCEYVLSDPEVLTLEVDLPGLLGDVNNNGKITIIDAQVCYDIANSKYDESTIAALLGCWPSGVTFDMVKTVADVNKDNAVEAADAFAIQYYVHYGKFGE